MSSDRMDNVVIIGGGHAAAQLCASLRKDGFTGAIVMISEEEVIPYHRPPLSKDYLKGKLDKSRLWIRPQSFYDDQNIQLILGDAVMRIDRTAQRVQLASGQQCAYDRLVIATGGRPRPLPVPGHDLPEIRNVRSVADIDSMKTAFDHATSVAVIGGGFIGLEAAAVARGLGKSVTLYEREHQLLARVCHTDVASRIEALHLEQGVSLKLGAQVHEIAPHQDSGVQIHTETGVQQADLVIAGIGILPNDDLASDAGLTCSGGIVCDETGQTSDPYIYAAGDVAVFPSQHHGGPVRLESVQNATDMAKVISSNLCRDGTDHTALPWFWSDQYDWKLQMAGLSPVYDRTEWRDGQGPHYGSLAYYREDCLIRIDAIGTAKHYVRGKKLIEQSATIDDVSQMLGPPA